MTKQAVECPRGFAKSVYFNNTKIGNKGVTCRRCGHVFPVTMAFGIDKRSKWCPCCRKKRHRDDDPGINTKHFSEVV